MGCTKGFEIVDLETLDTQALLDPSDASLDFVQKREDVRPMAIFRIDNDFLLCYDGECTVSIILTFVDTTDRLNQNHRVRLLREQEWMESTAVVYGLLGRPSSIIR